MQVSNDRLFFPSRPSLRVQKYFSFVLAESTRNVSLGDTPRKIQILNTDFQHSLEYTDVRTQCSVKFAGQICRNFEHFAGECLGSNLTRRAPSDQHKSF